MSNNKKMQNKFQNIIDQEDIDLAKKLAEIDRKLKVGTAVIFILTVLCIFLFIKYHQF